MYGDFVGRDAGLVRLITITCDCGAIRIILRIGGIVVAKLQDYEIPELDVLQHLQPEALRDVRATAASTVRFVVDVNLCRIEKRSDLRAPSPCTLFAIAGTG